MAPDVSPTPDGMNTVTPYLVVPEAMTAIELYQRAFGAELVMRLPGPGGQGTMHAEIRLGDSVIMLTDENPQWEMKYIIAWWFLY